MSGRYEYGCIKEKNKLFDVAKVSVEVASLSIRLSCLEDMNMVV